MKSDLLFDAIGELPDKYVQDARPATVLKRKVPWGVWAAAAACLVIAVLVAVPLLNDGANSADAARDIAATNEVVEENENAKTGGTAETTAKTTAEILDAEAADEPEAKATGTAGGAYGDADPSGLGALTIRLYENYDDFFTFVQNPVFEAIFYTDVAQRHYLGFTVQGFEADDGTFEPYAISMDFDAALLELEGFSLHEADPQISFCYDDANSNDSSYADAEAKGLVSEYQVDGVDIQKFNLTDYNQTLGIMTTIYVPYYCERVDIDGAWYYVEGSDEAEVDEIAVELARIANEL